MSNIPYNVLLDEQRTYVVYHLHTDYSNANGLLLKNISN